MKPKHLLHSVLPFLFLFLIFGESVFAAPCVSATCNSTFGCSGSNGVGGGRVCVPNLWAPTGSDESTVCGCETDTDCRGPWAGCISTNRPSQCRDTGIGYFACFPVPLGGSNSTPELPSSTAYLLIPLTLAAIFGSRALRRRRNQSK